MIIEAGSGAEAQQLVRKLLAAARHPSDVKTVHRGSRLAFSVPDELGRAVGREPDATEADPPPAAADRPADSSEQPSAEREQQDSAPTSPAPAVPATFTEPATEPPAPVPAKKTRRKAH